ncbi:AAA family ATPase [Burkholderia ubonensis]|uniref:AAA family ATPase n=1 Tax=Burkholderia ubonensis TaxID=101571 RepID=UPI0009B434EA|nr:AAA family ATPase [Burkholderia ubonensis]
MQFIKFDIENFRGIKHLSINLERNPQASVFTIVGLNESGKSTILEAISQMGRKPMNLSAHDPARGNTSEWQYQSFIPVSERFNFNGVVSLKATLRFSATDKIKLRNFLSNELGIASSTIQDILTIEKKIQYKDSSYESMTSLWSIDPQSRKTKGRKVAQLSKLLGRDGWLKFVNFIESSMLPHILYFKSEVFDFPNKITIWANDSNKNKAAGEKSKSEINKFYFGVVEDILHAIDPTMNIQSHIVERKKSLKSADGQNLAALLHKISSHVTQTVMKQWENIFQRKLTDKRVVASCDFDEDGSIYLQFKIHDGSQLFDITDRSAGFRWFFSFIVLTQYRGKKTDSALFLYDEPASNLHSAAQKQLIDCFRSMPEHFKAIYTTHSHYLINPEWLDSAFVAQNLGITPDDLSLDFDSTQTNIRLTPYRKFVSDNPSQISYFQPVLDVLHYSPSRLEPINRCVLLEGKNDYYGLKYLLAICLQQDLEYDLIPCGGSGTVDQLIALYAGWGKNFLVLLDSDAAGHGEKRRYIDKFGSLAEGNIFTYGDIDKKWNGFALEKVIGKSDLETIQKEVYPESEYNKKQFFLATQELLMKKRPVKLSDQTTHNLLTINSTLAQFFLI